MACDEEEAYAGSSRREMSAWRVLGWYDEERDEACASGILSARCVLEDDLRCSEVDVEFGEWSYMVVGRGLIGVWVGMSSRACALGCCFCFSGCASGRTAFRACAACRYCLSSRLRSSSYVLSFLCHACAELTAPQTVVPVYQLFILGNETTSLISMAPGSGNTHAEKAAFYIFQAVPEVVTSGTLLAINAKEVFGM